MAGVPPVIWNGQVAKVLTNQLAVKDGTVSAPGFCFYSEQNSGLYRLGTGDIALAVAGTLGLEAIKVGSNVNFGFGQAASTSSSVPLLCQSSLNGSQYFQYGNANTGTTSGTIFQITNGPVNLSNATTVENYAYTTTGYLAGGSVLAATAFQTQLNIMSEYTAGSIRFNVGGRTLATEAMRLGITGTGLTLNKGWGSLTLSGATSGGVTFNAGATGTYSINYPTANAAGVWLNDGAGNLSFLASTSAATASANMVRDANANVAVNNILEGYTTTATAAGTTTLVVGSTFQQFFTGATTQTVLMPVTSTLVLGMQYLITNQSTGVVTVQSSGANTIQAMASNTQLTLTCILTSGTTAASWQWTYSPIASAALPIAIGGTAKTAVTVAAAASSWAGWDANKNLSANNMIEAYTTTATAAGTTTLVVGSTYQQYFTGATTQTVALPVATTLVNGQQFQITNLSSGVVTVQTSGANTIQAMGANTTLILTCSNTAGGTGTASWTWVYSQNNASIPLTSPMTNLGDSIVGAAGGTPARLAVGTNGFVHTSDSTATNGISWQNPANFKNRLVNGAFDYWQAGTLGTVTATGGATPTATYLYQTDQWYVNNILGGGTIEGIITYLQVSGVTNGSKYGAKVQITTAPTGTGIQNGLELYQPLSNLASRPLYGQTASFSILVKSFGNVTQVGVQFYYATTEVKLTTAIGSEVLTTVNTSTFTACTINGQALGTAQTFAGIVGVRIRPTAVSAGNLYDLNNGFVVEQAMLNLGPVAMPFCRQYEDPAGELSSCQYFYQKSYNPIDPPGTITDSNAHFWSSAGSNGLATFVFKTSMRASATMIYYSPVTGATGKFRDVSTSADVVASSNSTSPVNQIAASGVSSASDAMKGHWTADARI